jgi:uncharacterized protein YjgD (DUF1641 family)
MKEKNMQEQIDAMNRKLDLVLEEIQEQREMRKNVSDLSADLYKVGKDMFGAAVTELDNAGVEIDGEAVKVLALKIIRNLGTLNELFDMLESAYDLIRDVSPVLHQVGLDGIKTLNKLEQKGYIDFIKESGKIIDNVVTHFSTEDIRALADNVVTILETVKSLTQPEMLGAINNGVVVYKSLDVNEIPEYSLFKAMRAMNSPELRKGLGFMITFLKNIATESELKAKRDSKN